VRLLDAPTLQVSGMTACLSIFTKGVDRWPIIMYYCLILYSAACEPLLNLWPPEKNLTLASRSHDDSLIVVRCEAFLVGSACALCLCARPNLLLRRGSLLCSHHWYVPLRKFPSAPLTNTMYPGMGSYLRCQHSCCTICACKKPAAFKLDPILLTNRSSENIVYY
jgi:hypothetical protein